jgi:hypothetical protein
LILFINLRVLREELLGALFRPSLISHFCWLWGIIFPLLFLPQVRWIVFVGSLRVFLFFASVPKTMGIILIAKHITFCCWRILFKVFCVFLPPFFSHWICHYTTIGWCLSRNLARYLVRIYRMHFPCIGLDYRFMIRLRCRVCSCPSRVEFNLEFPLRICIFHRCFVCVWGWGLWVFLRWVCSLIVRGLFVIWVPLWATGLRNAADYYIMRSPWIILTTFLLSYRSMGVMALAENMCAIIDDLIYNFLQWIQCLNLQKLSIFLVNGWPLFLPILVVGKIVFYDLVKSIISKTYHKLYIFYYLFHTHVLSHLNSVESFPNFYLYEEEQFIIVYWFLFSNLVSLFEAERGNLVGASVVAGFETIYSFYLSWFLHSDKMLIKSDWCDLGITRNWCSSESFIVLLFLINDQVIAIFLFLLP